jgi:uncharacterized protein YndB with AHSA1/START domain
MARVSRRRVIDADVGEVWALISDPYHLPRWWPRATRVENVHQVPGGRRSHWTLVLSTKSGKPVRADYRCTSSAEPKRYAWEQDVADTPFERIVRRSGMEILLRGADGGTEVTLESEQALRGLSRLGSPMMRRANKRTLAEALDGLESALGGGEEAPAP